MTSLYIPPTTVNKCWTSYDIFVAVTSSMQESHWGINQWREAMVNGICVYCTVPAGFCNVKPGLTPGSAVFRSESIVSCLRVFANDRFSTRHFVCPQYDSLALMIFAFCSNIFDITLKSVLSEVRKSHHLNVKIICVTSHFTLYTFFSHCSMHFIFWFITWGIHK